MIAVVLLVLASAATAGGGPIRGRADQMRAVPGERCLFLATARANAALFDEKAMPAGRQMTFGWLWLGLYVLAGLICSALCGYVAVCRGLAPMPWFFAGLVGNVVGLALVMSVRRGDTAALPGGIPRGFAKVPTTRAPSACPACGVTNHPSARRCTGCGASLSPTVEAETGRDAS